MQERLGGQNFIRKLCKMQPPPLIGKLHFEKIVKSQDPSNLNVFEKAEDKLFNKFGRYEERLSLNTLPICLFTSSPYFLILQIIRRCYKWWNISPELFTIKKSRNLFKIKLHIHCQFWRITP